jgi:hypothetical protein
MLFLLILSAAATPVVAMSKPLQPMAFLAGHCWSSSINAGKQVDTHCFEAMHGGRQLRDRHEVKDRSGKVVYSGETIYAWNAKNQRVEYAYFASDGGVSYGNMTPRAGVLDFGDETYTGPDGKQIKISTLWRLAGGGEYEAVSQSENMPTGQRVSRYLRVDKP